MKNYIKTRMLLLFKNESVFCGSPNSLKNKLRCLTFENEIILKLYVLLSNFVWSTEFTLFN